MEKGIRLCCQRCNHIWNYKGEKEYYVSCPNCYTKVSINKSSVGGKDGKKGKEKE
jgi:hypothetical protein